MYDMYVIMLNLHQMEIMMQIAILVVKLTFNASIIVSMDGTLASHSHNLGYSEASSFIASLFFDIHTKPITLNLRHLRTI